ncbi:hypothetical protein CATRI_03470 [Corynebacterium atrinae]|uniref:DedA family protein n=1 Tax=Corynebacterium atrinae TaxID=1336740 RepID=UPI0025B34C8C|nr:DedA family protein [Corynebacterium atrinae]WJY62792.1 hypothetical protein CATRI_03470 [Corynebacterium atrinae]
MLNSIVDWVVSLMESLGAPGVGIAILLESVFPPIPSEVVLPLAGFTSTQGTLNVYAAFLFATLGSVLGAYLLYWLGAAVGADRLRRIAGRLWLVDPSDVDRSLAFFDRYGKVSIFFGRLIPGIRSLISIPAGIDRMSLLTFGALTATGSAIWNAFLIWLGVLLGERYQLVEVYIGKYATVIYALVALALAGALIYLIRRDRVHKRATPPVGSEDTTK